MRSSAADDESKDGQPPPEAPATGALRGVLQLKGTLGRWRECFCELALREGEEGAQLVLRRFDSAAAAAAGGAPLSEDVVEGGRDIEPRPGRRAHRFDVRVGGGGG